MKRIKKFFQFITEDIETIDDVFEIINEVERDVLWDIKNGETSKYKLINPSQYKKALDNFVKFNDLHDFPIKYIYRWKKMIIIDMAMLMAFNGIFGHGDFDMDHFHDVFNYSEETMDSYGGEFDKWLEDKDENPKDNRYEWSEMFDFLEEKYNLEKVVPKFTNGHVTISDYGLETIGKRIGIADLVHKMATQQDPIDILISINKIMDVAHMRSDLAELFIVGGSKSLNIVAGFNKKYNTD